MNIYETIKTRRSVRAYKDGKIDDVVLNRILEAARLAPSAHNNQEYKFVVVKDAAKRKALAKAALDQKFVGEAPMVIAGVALNPNHIMTCGVPAYVVDLAIAFDHITLTAVEEGLGTCWIGAFYQNEVKKILNIPEKYKVVVLLPLGVPKDRPGKKTRKKLKELVCYDNFSEYSFKKTKNGV